MRIYISQEEPDERGRGGGPTPGTSWVRFGEETLLLSDETEEAMARAHGRKAPALESHVEVRRDELHVVVQNGRLFQQHNPDVPVIHDRGHYLLVKLEPARARKLASSHPTCYGVSPLAEREVVFEARGAGVAARAPPPLSARPSTVCSALALRPVSTSYPTLDKTLVTAWGASGARKRVPGTPPN